MPDLTAEQRAELERRGWADGGDRWLRHNEDTGIQVAVIWDPVLHLWFCRTSTTVREAAEFAAVVGLPIPGYVMVPADVAQKALRWFPPLLDPESQLPPRYVSDEVKADLSALAAVLKGERKP